MYVCKAAGLAVDPLLLFTPPMASCVVSPDTAPRMVNVWFRPKTKMPPPLSRSPVSQFPISERFSLAPLERVRFSKPLPCRSARSPESTVRWEMPVMVRLA